MYFWDLVEFDWLWSCDFCDWFGVGDVEYFDCCDFYVVWVVVCGGDFGVVLVIVVVVDWCCCVCVGWFCFVCFFECCCVEFLWFGDWICFVWFLFVDCVDGVCFGWYGVWLVLG